MSGLKEKVVLITGSSSGIGAATAIVFAHKGSRLSLVARNTEKLEDIAAKCRNAGSPDVLIGSHDLSSFEACDTALKETIDHFKGKSSHYSKLRFRLVQLHVLILRGVLAV